MVLDVYVAAPMEHVGGLPVRATEHIGLAQVRGATTDGEGQVVQHVPLDVTDELVQLRQGHLGRTRLTQSLRFDVPHLPGRPGGLQHLQDVPRNHMGTRAPTRYGGAPLPRPQGRGDQLGDGFVAAQPTPGIQGVRLLEPLVALLSLAARFVLDRPGLQVRLLRKSQ